MLEEAEILSMQPEPVKVSQDPSKRGGAKEVLAISLPMVISLSFDSLMTFIDRLFLSKIGSEQMSASLAGGLASFLMNTFFIGLIGYATAMVAQNIGSGKPRRASQILSHAVGLSLLSYPLILLLRPLAYHMFDSFKIDPRQLEPQLAYFDILVYGSVIGLVRHSFSSFFSGIGETRVVMIASFVGLVTNTILNYMLIFGHGGFPAMGIQGAAIGTISASGASLLVLVIHYYSKSIRERFHSAMSMRFDISLVKEFLRKGTPSGVEMLLNLLAFQLIILMFHGTGLVNAAAATIMFNWDMLTFIPLLGLEIATTSLVGRYAGAKDYASAERSTWTSIKLGWVFSIFVTIAFFLIPEVLVNVFKPDPMDAIFPEAFPIAVTMIRIASAYIMIESAMVGFAGALRGAGDTFWTMVIMVCLHWVIVMMLWLSTHVLHLGPIQSWIVLVVGFMLFPLVLWLRWRTGKWKTMVVEPGF